MFEVTISRSFSAAHAIRLYAGALEPLHGHDWPVEVTIGCDKLDEIDLVIDFHVLEGIVDDLISQVHNRNLNQVAPFADREGELVVNPTAERVAWWLGNEIARKLPKRCHLVSIRVGEAPGCYATFRP